MELKFNSDTKHRKQWFTGISFSHPAKMILTLQIWLIDNYTKPGDIVLDPMAGSGTILTACSMGRHVIAVELEDKFIKMMQGNWEKVKQRGPQLGYEMGTVQIIHGDARNLEGLLADKIITSPPYAGAQTGGGIAQEGYTRAYQKDKISGGNRDPVGKRSYMPENAFSRADNIQSLPYGTIDSVVSSPPYEGIESRDRSIEPSFREGTGKYPRRGDVNISSGYKGEISAVVTSPPYEGQMDGGSRHTKGGIPERDKALKKLGPYDTVDKANIGNMYRDTYLDAMLLVYQQCQLVLRPGGIMVLVTKNFIRDKKQVDLAGDTISLCEAAGFTFKERHYRKLTTQSFWRTIYHQKYPEVEPIKFEDIMVFTK